MVERAKRRDTIAILRGLKERYEVHHGVRIKDAAILAAARFSHRYISDRFQTGDDLATIRSSLRIARFRKILPREMTKSIWHYAPA